MIYDVGDWLKFSSKIRATTLKFKDNFYKIVETLSVKVPQGWMTVKITLWFFLFYPYKRWILEKATYKRLSYWSIPTYLTKLIQTTYFLINFSLLGNRLWKISFFPAETKFLFFKRNQNQTENIMKFSNEISNSINEIKPNRIRTRSDNGIF